MHRSYRSDPLHNSGNQSSSHAPVTLRPPRLHDVTRCTRKHPPWRSSCLSSADTRHDSWPASRAPPKVKQIFPGWPWSDEVHHRVSDCGSDIEPAPSIFPQLSEGNSAPSAQPPQHRVQRLHARVRPCLTSSAIGEMQSELTTNTCFQLLHGM